MKETTGLSHWTAMAVCYLAVSGVLQGAPRDDRNPNPALSVVIGPGIWHCWFDSRLPENVESYLQDRLGQEFDVTQVEMVKLDQAGRPVYGDDGRVQTATGYVLGFQFKEVYQELDRSSIPTVVSLEPGPAVGNLARPCRDESVRDWLLKHSHNGGTEGNNREYQ